VSSCGRRREQRCRTRKDKQGSAPDCADAQLPMMIRGGGNPHTAMAAMPLGEWTRRFGALPAEAYDCFMVGAHMWVQPNTSVVPRRSLAARGRLPSDHECQTTRSRASCRRARDGQGQAFGGAEALSLTVAARDGECNMRSGRKNARGAGRTKE
jgi:hypothetical protein